MQSSAARLDAWSLAYTIWNSLVLCGTRHSMAWRCPTSRRASMILTLADPA